VSTSRRGSWHGDAPERSHPSGPMTPLMGCRLPAASLGPYPARDALRCRGNQRTVTPQPMSLPPTDEKPLSARYPSCLSEEMRKSPMGRSSQLAGSKAEGGDDSSEGYRKRHLDTVDPLRFRDRPAKGCLSGEEPLPARSNPDHRRDQSSVQDMIDLRTLEKTRGQVSLQRSHLKLQSVDAAGIRA
jgi:hypothetical protein